MSTIAPTRPTSPATLPATPAAAPISSELYRFNVNQYERHDQCRHLDDG